MRCGTVYLEGSAFSHISVARTPEGLSVTVAGDGVCSTKVIGRSEAETLAAALDRAVRGWDE